MKHHFKIAIATVALGISSLGISSLAAFTLASTEIVPSARSGEAALIQVAASERVQSFVIEHMYCASCPFIVRRTIEGVAGVRSVEVNFAAETATVVYDPSRTTVEAIVVASTNAGYPATATN